MASPHSRLYAVAEKREADHTVGMATKMAERRRARIRQILAMRPDISVNSWAKAARISESVIRDFLDQRKETMTLTTYDKLAAAIGLTVGELLGDGVRMIAVAGYVGAGEEIIPIDDSQTGAGIDEVEAPPGAAPDAVAVKVRGHSMFPAYWDGDVLIYRREVPFDRDACLYNECVVRLLDGRMFIKRIMPGSSDASFTLQSYNAGDILDAQIEWAAPIQIHDKRHRRAPSGRAA